MVDRTVLIVDDEPAVADGWAAWLEDRYRVETAYDGHEALSAASAVDPDVVLLDRRMPGLSGAEVLCRLKDRPEAARVAMLTAVQPDGDVLAMPFDDYLLKPVDPDELRSTVEVLFTRASYDEQLQVFFSVASKVAALETERDEAELAAMPEYDRLCERLNELKSTLDDRVDEIGAAGFDVAIDTRISGRN